MMRAKSREIIKAASILMLVALLALPRTAAAVGEQVGRIRGVVSDPNSGTPLPGLSVKASSPAMIGGARTVYTNDDGRYELPNLPPGDYTVEFTFPGMATTTRKVAVHAGESTPLNFSYSLEGTVETVAIVEQKESLTKPDSTKTGTNLDAETLNDLPTARTYQNAALQVPGVSGGMNPNIKGGMSNSNHYLIDGLDVTDPVQGIYSINLTFDSIASVDVLTGGMDAQYNSLGGVINVITREGSDQFHLNTSIYANHNKLSTKGNFGLYPWEFEQPFNSTPSNTDQSYQFAVNVGGPILKQRLWYGATYELRMSETSALKGPPLGSPPYNIQHPSRELVNHLARLKLTYAPAVGHRISFSSNVAPASMNNNAGGGKNNFLGVAENGQRENAIFSVLSWDWLATSNLNPNVQAGVIYTTSETGPLGRLGAVDFTGCDKFSAANCTYEPDRARRVNNTDGTIWYQGGNYSNDRRYKLQLEPSLSVRGVALGQHDARVGVQAQYNRRDRSTEVPGGAVYTDSSPGKLPFEAGLCDPMTGVNCFRKTESADYSQHETGYGYGIYVQDRWWTPLRWLTINPGVRFDWGYTGGMDRDVSRLFGISPRLGLIADVTRDGKNILFAYYGRHTDTLLMLPASQIDSTDLAQTTEKQWDPMTMDYTIVTSQSGGPGGTRIDPNPKAPHSDEISAGARREFFPGTVAGFEYTWKRIENLWSAVEVNRVWDPSGTRIIDWQDKNLAGRDVWLYTTRADNFRQYQGVDIYTNGRPTENWSYGASYSLSWVYGTGTGVGNAVSSITQYENPRQQRFISGFFSQDARHRLRLYGSYKFWKQLTVGGNFRWETGGPSSKTFYRASDASYSNYRSPISTTPGIGNDLNAIADFRGPDVTNLDIHLGLNVLPGRLGQKLQLIADVFNALNLREPGGVVSADRATFGQATGRGGPLRVQVGLSYLY